MSIVAIDFGTSNTVVCVLDPVTQTPRTLDLKGISRQFGNTSVVPTVAFRAVNGAWVIGEPVRQQRLGFGAPDRYFHAFKRDLVADYQPPPRRIDGETYSPEQIAELFLAGIWEQVLQQVEPTQVILTVPVGAFERYLDWFRAVAEQLHLPGVQLVDESTAAALGYAIGRPGALVLVVDFGGGTLDLSLVRINPPSGPDQNVLRATVLAKSDGYVGGVDVDIWIVEDYLRRLGSSRAQVGEIGWQNLLELAERIKIRLSYTATVKESWFDDEAFMAYDLQYSQDQLAEILETQQLLEQVRRCLDEVLAKALGKGVAKADIEQVLMVGGSCQIPAVQNLVVSYFGRARVKLDRPFEAVAHGALALGQICHLSDELRHSYAVRLWEPYSRSYSYYPIFAKGSAYPAVRSERLTLQVATQGQREIRLDIGELAELSQAEVSYDAQGRMTSTQLRQREAFRSLEASGEATDHPQVCIARLDPPGQTGSDRIAVQFEVTADRALVVTVQDLLTDRILVERQAIAALN
jgi:molecular chaperone DnaK (HSP70)